MIRVNLLAVERERTKRRGSFEWAQKLTVACSLILVVTALGIGWWYWSLAEQSKELNANIEVAQRESQRLRDLITQVRQFEQRRGQLQQRVSLIEQLRKGQSAPVHILDEISRSLPDTLWLSDLKQDGAVVTLTGRCLVLTNVSDFARSLESSGYFKVPVDIIESQAERSNDMDLFRFTVRVEYAPPAG